MAYIVNAPVVLAQVGPSDVLLHLGQVLPEGTRAEQVEHLLAVGLIKEQGDSSAVPVESVAPAAAVELDDMTVEQLKAYAAERQIDLGDATKKDAIRAAIDAAVVAS